MKITKKELLTETKLKKITQKIVRDYQPEKIILFGSVAWGKNKSNDLDLLIIKRGIEKEKIGKRYRQVSRLIDHSVPMDLLIYTPYEIKKRLYLGDPFIKKIMDKGRVIYGA